MLIEPQLEELLKRVDNRYTLTMFAAKRARQLTDGGQALVRNVDKEDNALSIAAKEIAANKIVALPGDLEVIIPRTVEYETGELAKAYREHADLGLAARSPEELAALSDTEAGRETKEQNAKMQRLIGAEYARQYENILSTDDFEDDQLTEAIDDAVGEYLADQPKTRKEKKLLANARLKAEQNQAEAEMAAKAAERDRAAEKEQDELKEDYHERRKAYMENAATENLELAGYSFINDLKIGKNYAAKVGFGKAKARNKGPFAEGSEQEGGPEGDLDFENESLDDLAAQDDLAESLMENATEGSEISE